MPNDYLHDIARHGIHYRESGAASLTHPITLSQSRPFRMRDPRQQADFFVLLAQVLNYLNSGQSHVGYLSNNPGNPYVRIPVYPTVRQLFDARRRTHIVMMWLTLRRWKQNFWKGIRRVNWTGSQRKMITLAR